MLKFDITLLVQIIEALILAMILNILLIKPVMNHIEERKRQFKGLEGEVEDLLRQVEEGLKNYQEALAAARAEGAQKREALKEEARKIEKEVLAKVAKEMEAQKREWEAQFRRDFSQLREAVLAQREYFANLIVEKLLGRKA
uniref:ATP synthase subunit b n=1 Tax=Caldimicrobium thiodismutans TaxID=1653476 RepID=A0A832LWE3_9BACT